MIRLFARSLLLQFVTLCTAFGVLWAPVAEAAECAGEPPVASQLAQHGSPGDDDIGPEKHGACVHGHCHHSSQAVERPSDAFVLGSAMSVPSANDQPSFPSNLTDLGTPPPRA